MTDSGLERRERGARTAAAGVALGCLALAVLSLLLPSQPSYDPWAWLQWGREIAFLELDTRNGPSWKPLPVLFTLLFAPLSALDDGIPPALWLVSARTGALIALALALRVTWRLAGPDRRVAASAGAVAVAALLLSPNWLRYMAHGNEAPMAVAFMLAALDRHLDGARRHAVALAFLACLLRPEVFPFLAGYAAFVWRAEPAVRRLIAGLALLLPLLWLVPEWIGSGDALGAARQARSEPSWSLSLEDRPWLAVLDRWQGMAGVPIEVGALLGTGFALRRRERVSLVLATLATSWLALVVLMTEAGFSGNSRYMLPPLVIASLLAGCGAARVVAAAAKGTARFGAIRVARRGGSGRPSIIAGAGVATALLAVATAPFLDRRLEGFRDQAGSVAPLADLHRQLAMAVERVGGPNAVTPYGAPTVNRKFDTHLAWELKLPIRHVEVGRGEGVVFKADGQLSGTPPRMRRPGQGMRGLVRVGAWSVGRPESARQLTSPAPGTTWRARTEYRRPPGNRD